MTTEFGLVQAVRTIQMGSILKVDHAAAAKTLQLEDVGYFNDAGGQLVVTSFDAATGLVRTLTTFTYTAVDFDNDTVTLDPAGAGLFEAGKEGDRVDLTPAASEKRASVTLAGTEDSIDALVPHFLNTNLPDGIRDPNASEAVVVSLDQDQWTIDNIFGIPPTEDASVTATTPPSSPTPSANGMKGAIFVKWPGIASTSPVSYELHVSTTPGFTATPGGSTMYTRTPATASVVNRLPDGSLLAYGTDYYFKTIAVAAGDVTLAAAPSAEDSEQMSLVAQEDVVAASILAAIVQAINVEAEVVTIGSAGGRQILMSLADGIKLLGSDGISTLVHMPLDGSAVKLTAEVIATFLTVTLGLEVKGTSNEISGGGGLVLAAGVSNPNNAPQVFSDWPNTTTLTALAANTEAYGMAKVGTNFYQAHTLFQTNPIDSDAWVARYNSSGTFVDKVSVSGINNEPEIYGLTYGDAGQGNRFFLLEYDINGNKWYIQVRDASTPTASTFVKRTDVTAALSWTFGTNDQFPTIGWDYEFNRVIIATFNVAGTVVTAKSYTENVSNTMINDTTNNGTWTSPTLAATSAKLTFINRGQFDYGASRMVIKNGRNSSNLNFRTFTITSPAEQTNEVWPIGNGSTSVRGAWWDGTNFWSYSNPRKQQQYTRNKWTTESAVWWFSTTIYDSDATGGTHETARSPRVGFTIVKRTRVIYLTANPADFGGTDDPDNIRFYLARGSTDPASTSHWLQGTATTGSLNVENAVFSGTNPPTVNNFPAGTPAWIKSATGGLEIYGDGLLKVVDLRGDRVTGSVTRTAAPFAKIYRATNQTLTTGTDSQILCTTLDEETDSTFGDTANSQLVVPIAGIYLVLGSVRQVANATGRRRGWFRLNGATLNPIDVNSSANGSVDDFRQVAWMGRLAANDTLQLFGEHTSGANLDAVAGINNTWIAARWLQP